MKKTELREVLDLVKDKMSRDVEGGCGILWTDDPVVTTYYAVGEEDGEPTATTKYAVGEED